MSRMVGTVSRGIRAPIIRNGDNIVDIVTDSILEAAKDDGFEIRDRDIIAMTEAVVARAQGNYASIDDIAKDVNAMTDEERTAYLTDRINLAYEITSAEKMINLLSANITAGNSGFRVNYQQARAAMSPLNQALDVINQEYAYADALLKMLKADANASAEEIAELEQICATYKLKSEEYSKMCDDFYAEMAVLNEEAYELGLLVKNDAGEYSLVSKYEDHTNFVNEALKEEVAPKEVYVNTKYTCDDGSIVVVTYGGKDGDDTAAYRSFILNYNIFAVTVKYEGVEYTIEPYGYQIINY